MNVQLLDVDLETTIPLPPIQKEEKRMFGYNRIDFLMMIFCGIVAVLIVVFLIWFLVGHTK